MQTILDLSDYRDSDFLEHDILLRGENMYHDVSGTHRTIRTGQEQSKPACCLQTGNQ